MLIRLALSLAVAASAALPAATAQPHAAHRIPIVPDELLTRTVPIRPGIGRVHDPVTTSSAEAQGFYDQGLAYLHGYVWIEAARSFHQALRVDPKLAMAEVGLTYAYAELNAPAKAQAALARARALAPSASAHDRRHLEVRALQMAAETVPDNTAALAAYRSALDAAVTAFPKDAELWLLRGIAESPDPADRGQGSGASSVPFYRNALAAAPDHFGAHHYLTHAFENSGRIDDAVRHAAVFAAAAPSVPHARHMHGHVLRRSGRIDEAIAVFEAADRVALEYFKAGDIRPELDWHYEHNLDLLGLSYRYLGQARQADATLRRAFDLPSSLVVQMVNKRGWPAFLTSRGRTADALSAAQVLVANPSPVVRAAGHIAAGHAHLAASRFAAAAEAANAALKELRASGAAASVAGPAFEALQGEFFLRTGQREKGRAMLQEAARKIRAAPGPDNWAQGLFALETMAAAGRAAGDWEFATWAAREMAAHDPGYAGTHYALGLAAEHNGDIAAAAAAFAQAGRLWARADPDLAELLVVRQKIDGQAGRGSAVKENGR